jgi:hypothetical protein
MNLLLCCAASLTLVSEPGLRTDYGVQRTLRITSDTALSTELSEFSMERDGEPVDASFDPGGSSSSDTRHVVEHFTVSEHDSGRPTVVLRAFEEARGLSERSMRGESQGIDRESPLEGAVVRVSIEDGERHVEIVEGDGPDDEELLQRFRPQLDLDLLLPPPDADGGAWDLERAAIVAALGLDLERVLFPEPEREPRDSGGRGDGERGRRGGPGPGSGGGSLVPMLMRADWEGNATPVGEEDLDGVRCAVIELVIEAEGEVDEPEGGFGPSRERRGRSPEPARAAPAPLATTYAVEIKGRLWFALEARHPLRLELEGEVTVERTSERERGESTLSMRMVLTGTFERTVVVTAVDKEEEAQ